MKRNPVRFFVIVFLILAVGTAALLALKLEWSWIISWLIGANLAAFMIWGYDKLQAKRSGWRVPENALHVMAFLGATPASFAGMRIFRHKTLKGYFTVLYVVFLVIHTALAVFLLMLPGIS